MKSRIFRIIICFLLVCCLLARVAVPRVEATGAGVVAGGIVKAASVSIPALWPIVAALAVVGITAYGIDSGAFENIANSCYSAFESAGTWINNGMAEILRTEDADGNVQFYVDGGMLEAVRSWAFSDSVVVRKALEFQDKYFPSADLVAEASAAPYSVLVYYNSGPYFYMAYSYESPIIARPYNESTGKGMLIKCVDSNAAIYGAGTFDSAFKKKTGTVYAGANDQIVSIQRFGASDPIEYTSSYDISLGYLPAEDTELDDTTVVTFHPYLAEVLRTRTGGSGDSGEDENKWWLAVAYAETLEKLYQTSQQAQIENPSVVEIPDLQEGTQYEVTVEEDEDGNKKYILNPIYDPGTNPGTGTDPDPGTNPGTGTNPDPGTDSNPDSGTDSEAKLEEWLDPKPQDMVIDITWSDFFPFCIPKDILDMVRAFQAEPEAPHFVFDVDFPYMEEPWHIDIDFSVWDPVALVLRRLELLLFVVGLAMATRNYYIRG